LKILTNFYFVLFIDFFKPGRLGLVLQTISCLGVRPAWALNFQLSLNDSRYFHILFKIYNIYSGNLWYICWKMLAFQPIKITLVGQDANVHISRWPTGACLLALSSALNYSQSVPQHHYTHRLSTISMESDCLLMSSFSALCFFILKLDGLHIVFYSFGCYCKTI
jgi:hypothetical protein